MLFVSTRGKTDLVCSAHAITRGLADDGGLFVPQKFPELSLGEIVSMRSMTYKERAVAILSLFLTDYTKEELFECADAAYAQAKFGAEPVPLRKVNENTSYVRMKVTFNNADKIIALCTDPEFEGEVTGVENAFPLIRMVNFVKANAAKWDGIIPDNMVDTEEMLANSKYFVKGTDNTLTYYFYYNGTVAAPDGNVGLPTLFDSIKVPTWVTGDQLAKLKDFQINVVAEAIQADGFKNADAAWAAFAAQQK